LKNESCPFSQFKGRKTLKKQILSEQEIEQIISRIAGEVIKRNPNPSNLIMVGVKSRGDVLAKRIAERIELQVGQKIETSAIDITFYRDDVQLKAYKYVVKDEIQFDVTDKSVVLVDDVMFTGRSIRAAIDALIDSGRPKSIQLAVLVDRNGRELPIQPDYVGQKIKASPESQVQVRVKEIDGEDKVIVIENEE